eukprot:2100429-Pleurochrysis_carterae.AAC.1
MDALMRARAESIAALSSANASTSATAADQGVTRIDEPCARTDVHPSATLARPRRNDSDAASPTNA